MNKMINSETNILIYFLEKSWSYETCYPKVRDDWSLQNKAFGQCAVTSLIANDFLGGDIYKCKCNGCYHYFNEINGKIFDLTKSQFKTSDLNYEKAILVAREKLLEDADTRKRYTILKNSYEEKLKTLDEINNKIYKCLKCKQLIEKYENYETIYIGTNPDILLLGEAPANNGWRKSKALWKNINGDILPSGLVLQKLLDSLDIDLFDLSFTEAVKCFPKKRSYLNQCNINCRNYLKEQIQLLEPKIVIVLGDSATRNILDFKYNKYSEVVGKIFSLEMDNISVKILPIYHPSPISPLSYKENIAIFEKIKEIL